MVYNISILSNHRKVNCFSFQFFEIGGESIRMYGGRRTNENPKSKFPTLMDDNSD